MMTRFHWVAFFGLVLAGWAALFAMAVPADLRALELTYGGSLIEALCGAAPGKAGFAGAVAMWILMSGAMMAPTTLPALAVYDDIGRATSTDFGRLVAGYLTVWAGFSFFAGIGQVLLYRTGLVGALGQSQSQFLSAFLLVLAGVYQFSSLKRSCLSRCRAPLAVFLQYWEEGPFRTGVRHGLDCLGCCWALMLLAFAGGVMNLSFMGLAMMMMMLEKLPEPGVHLTRPLGWLLISLGAAVLLF